MSPDRTSPARAATSAAALRYVSDDIPGIRRRKRGAGFAYTRANGSPLRDARTRERIRALAIPPAWTDVWICPVPNGHLQATGRDARGRKQYRYHTRWREVRDESKYARLEGFARALPSIRRRVRADLRRAGLPREKVLAVIVRLLETTFIRVGNEEYARTNGSFGLTTLQDRHARPNGSRVQLRFRGKSRKFYTVDIADRRLAQIVKRCRDLPGQHLFQYLDDDGKAQRVGSGDVNDYLREVTGEEYTAKDFRTWGATLLATELLRMGDAGSPQKKNGAAPSRSARVVAPLGKRAMLDAVEAVAERLGNTPAICRASYIHPAVLDAYLDDDAYARCVAANDAARVTAGGTRGLAADERALLRFLGAARRAGARKRTRKSR